MAIFATEPGSAHPLGIAVRPDGVNFSLFSESATEVELLLFDSATAVEPVQTVRFDPFLNKTFHFWHVFVRDCCAGTFYAFRIDGPNDPAEGHRFNPNKVLISPYARGLCNALWKRADAVGPQDNIATSMRCVIVDPAAYDWEGDQPLHRRLHESVIYEVHVGGLTRSPSAGRRRLHPRPRRKWRAARPPAGHLADRAGRCPGGHEDDRRGVGRGRLVSGRTFPRRSLG